MPRYSEEKILSYTPDQLFDLVADIARYHEFLPFCTSSRVISTTPHGVVAELTIGYKMISERFVSRVTFDRAAHAIKVDYVSGPLKALCNEWRFRPHGKRKTRVEFLVQFEFSNPFFRTMASLFFDVVYTRMVASFEKRAEEIYGASRPPKTR